MLDRSLAMVCYRVSFEGDELTDAATRALTGPGVWWEGTASGPEEPSRHRALVYATDEQEAIEAVQSALAGYGSFGEYLAAAVRNARGEVWRGPFYRKWSEIDWQATPERAGLTDLQRAVLGTLVEWGLPTWMVLRDIDVTADRATVEAVLEDLQQQGLVYSTREASGEPGRESEPDRWWAITHQAWDLLGFIKSPRYR
jgi:hypothetical protein